MLGMCFRNREQWKLSLPYLLRATELDSRDESFLFQYGLSLAQGELLEEAQKTFEKVLELNKEHSDAYYNLGVIALFHEKTKEALHHFEKALELQSDHVLAANGKKIALQYMEQFEDK